MPPRVSVVMTVYNDLRFLAAAVESVLRQDYQDFELILVDDGTGHADIIARHASRDRRIRVVRNEANLGAMGAANRGIRTARGDIIARLDADDIAEPQRLGRLVAALDADPELGLVGSSFRNIDEADIAGTIIRMPETNLDVRWTILFRNPFCHSTVAFRRRHFDEAGGYNEAWRASGDHEFWFRMLPLCRAENIADVLVQYRVNPRGLSAIHSHNWRLRTDPLRERCWAQLGVPYDPPLAFELSQFIFGASVVYIERRAASYRVCLRLLRRFLDASRPFARRRDTAAAQRLARRTVSCILGDETVDASALRESEDLSEYTAGYRDS